MNYEVAIKPYLKGAENTTVVANQDGKQRTL